MDAVSLLTTGIGSYSTFGKLSLSWRVVLSQRAPSTNRPRMYAPAQSEHRNKTVLFIYY